MLFNKWSLLRIIWITEISSARDVETSASVVVVAAAAAAAAATSCPPCSDQRPQQEIVKAGGSVQATINSGG